MGIRIANLRSITPHRLEPTQVRIDRRTPFGNPFIIPRDGDREQVIAKYQTYIAKHPEIVEQLRALNPTVLYCWCAPLACHGDVLKALLEGD